ncbi:hypothetical protein BGZ76_004399 [Entomortierella beljakovae]|nr:hypothetical protein BGZ76_004399 [Entomortierella beljakovae]
MYIHTIGVLGKTSTRNTTKLRVSNPLTNLQKRKRVTPNSVGDKPQGWSEEGTSIIVDWFSVYENFVRFNNLQKGDSKTMIYRELCDIVMRKTGVRKDVLSVKNKIQDMKKSYAKAFDIYNMADQSDSDEEELLKDAVLKKCSFFYKVHDVWESAIINRMNFQLIESDRNHDTLPDSVGDKSPSDKDSEEEVELRKRSTKRYRSHKKSPALMTTTEVLLGHLDKLLAKETASSSPSFDPNKQIELEIARIRHETETQTRIERDRLEYEYRIQREKEETCRQKEAQETERCRIELEKKKLELEILKTQFSIQSGKRKDNDLEPARKYSLIE